MTYSTKSTGAQLMRELDDGRFEFVLNEEFAFEGGGSINPLDLAYETYGELNAEKNNAIVVHHALSVGSHLAATEKNSEDGWWEHMVGPDRPIDTNKYFVICINNLGSCFGSSGPTSINPKTGKRYGVDFPAVTMVDMVRSQKLLVDTLGIQKLHAVVGSSMGAMLSITWLALYPEHADYLVSISSCSKVYPANAANRLLQREIVKMDSAWQGGGYRSSGELEGFKNARKIGLLTYRNGAEINTRFMDKNGRDSIEHYLAYNAEKFVNRFDCNSYLTLLEAMDLFDLEFCGKELVGVFRPIKAKVLIIAVDSDVLFPPAQQWDLYRALLEAGVDVGITEHHSNYGHDAFLVETDWFGKYIREFIDPASCRPVSHQPASFEEWQAHRGAAAPSPRAAGGRL